MKRDAIGERAGDERGGNDGKHHLIGDKDEGGNGVVRGRRVEIDPAEKSIVKVADDAMPVPAEAQGVSIEVPDDGRPAHGHKALDHDGQDVLASHQPAIKEGQTRRHQHDQARAQDHKTGIAGIKMQHANLQGRCLEERSRNGEQGGSKHRKCGADGGPADPAAQKRYYRETLDLFGDKRSAVGHRVV